MDTNYEHLCKKINIEYCQKTDNLLSDKSLLSQFKTQPSTIKKILMFEKIFKKNNINSKIANNILNDILPIIIPAGTKDVIRGLEFNKIVKEKIKEIKLPYNLKVKFEKMCVKFPTDEIPDWYILDSKNKKILIGMNQIDLWSGGAQTNRGSKYILQQKKSKNKKIVCVICKKPKITINNKCFKLFNIGFQNNTLCYISYLETIINDFFKIKLD